MIPLSWKIGAGVLLVSALVVGHAVRVSSAYKSGHAAAVSERAARDGVAIVARVQENAAVSIKQDAINAVLTKAKNEELAPVLRRIATERVRVGPAICGPTAAPEAESPASSDSGDSSGRLVPSDSERDLRALTEAVEKDLATGRACQAFVRENGLVP
jgi:hypothetical protein